MSSFPLKKAAAAVVEIERECHVDLLIFKKDANKDIWQKSTTDISIMSKGRFRSPGVLTNAFRPTGQFTKAARTIAYNAVASCAFTLLRNFNFHISQNNENQESLFSQSSEQWRLTSGSRMCSREHARTTRRRSKVEGAPWDSPVRIAQKFLCMSSTDGFPGVQPIWLELRTRGRQTCNPSNSSRVRDIAFNPFERDPLPGQIRTITSPVFGDHQAAPRCEGGKPRLAPKLSIGTNIRVLLTQKFPTLEKRYQIKKA